MAVWGVWDDDDLRFAFSCGTTPSPSSPSAPDLGGELLRENLIVEVVPERAVAIIEREDGCCRRATRWVFDD